MYKKSVLKNDLRVVTHDMKERDSIAVGIWVGVGGRYESDRIKGAAHFLEHIVFKGSKKFSCEEIKEKIEGVGGALNAFTSEEQTCFYAKIPAKHLVQTFDVLSDMVFFPKINPKDVTKEKTVIVEEIKMYHDLPQFLVQDHLDALLWPEHPLGKNLAGSPETVTHMSAGDLKAFHQQYYYPKNIVVAACGQIKHNDIVQLSEKFLGKVKANQEKQFIPAKNDQESPRVKIFHKDIEQMHLAMGMLGYHEKDPRRFALSLLGIVMGGNMSSRLFVEVREKRGLAYSISSSTKSMHDTGVFMVRAGVDNAKIVDALALILKQLDKVRHTLVSKSEFTRARDYLLGQLLIGLEDTMEHMLWLGDNLVAKDQIRSIQHVVADFEKVTLADLKSVAREVLDPKRFNLSLVGPITDVQQKEIESIIGKAK